MPQCAVHKGGGGWVTNLHMMGGGMRREFVDGETVENGRGAPAGAVDARTLTGLRAIARRARGWTCDVRAVALDDQSGNLHVPLLERVDRRSPSVRVTAGELIVRRVEEFAIAGPPRTRWFELGRLSFDGDTRRMSIGPEGRSQFDLTVEALDVSLRIRPQTRPRG